MNTDRVRFFPGWVLTLLAATWAAGALAQSVPCSNCHESELVSSPAHGELSCNDCHLGVEEQPDPEAGHWVEIETEGCDSCHSREQRTVGRSVHDGQAECGDCHGPAHEVLAPDELASPLSPTHQIRTCGQCHDSVMDGYLTSIHARALLVSGLVEGAPSCTDCHGSGHGTRAHEDDRSGTGHRHIPETCGACHAGILRTWLEESAHGMAWQEGADEPVCSTCHTAHTVTVPVGETRLHFPDQCGSCHGELYSSYRGGFHGQATELGFEASAICSDCHTPHANLPADDPRSSIHPTNLAATCGQCHGEVSEAFLTFDPHSRPTDPERSPKVYYVWLFMTALLLGVFGFFALHDFLWLQRSLVAWLKGERPARPAGDGPHVVRFRSSHIWTHVTVVVTFLLLAATGLPIKFHSAAWAQGVIDLFGGIETARWLHRVAAVATFGYAIFHVGQVLASLFRGRARGVLWGFDSLVPQPQDVIDVLKNLRYFLYLGPKPEGGRWTYCEKFDYMAVFWGVPIIGGSGLVLWFPDFFTSFLPGWTLNAAHVIHSDEALLATGFIFVFHFFHTHLRPESFPMDPVIFTGRMPLERFKEERPLEFQRLEAEGRLEIVDSPSPAEMRKAYLFGFTALTIGVLLAVAIFWALIGQLLN